MPDSQNLEPKIYTLGFPYYEPSTGNVVETVRSNILPGDMGDFKWSNAAYCVQMMVYMQQVWQRLIVPDTPHIIGSSGVVFGSGQLTFGFETLSRVEWEATQIPSWKDQQAGNPPRYPHLGHFAFVYAGMYGRLTQGETKYITMQNQTFFPENQSAGGFWWRLNPSIRGFFTAGDWAAKRQGMVYGYGLTADQVANPFTGNPVIQQPST